MERVEETSVSVIDRIAARQILDSRGNPTVEVDVLESARWVAQPFRRGVPPASTRRVELRDGDPQVLPRQRRPAGGRKRRSPSRPGRAWSRRRYQAAVDGRLIELDGTPNKSALGANALLGVSLAVAKAAAGRRRPVAVPLAGREEAVVLPCR